MSNPNTSPEAKYQWRTSRSEAPRRSVSQRIGDFLEIYGQIDERVARDEASRCLECHHAPCVEGCPMGNQIPRWMALVVEGRFSEATALLAGSGCMPDVVSRICRQTCEDYCVLEKTGAPVAVNAIERFLNHYAQEHNLPTLTPHPANGWRVAVVGSGPSGLACTVELVSAGFSVSVFETQPLLGGFLVQGMPSFRVEQSFVQRRIQELKNAGVQFQTSVRWGTDLTLTALREKFDAVFLGPCLEGTKPLAIPGANLQGVYQALDFIIQMNFPWTARLQGLDVQGKKVVVLGGGDTAVDCLRTALRSGAREALCLYRRGRDQMPADPRQVEEALAEGGKFEFNVLPLEVLGNDQRVTSVRCTRTAQSAGSAEPEPLNRTEFQIEADVVLPAYGFVRPWLLSDSEVGRLQKNEFNALAVDQHGMTSAPGVFAAGVLVNPALGLTESVRDARNAARGIAAYLAAKTK